MKNKINIENEILESLENDSLLGYISEKLEYSGSSDRCLIEQITNLNNQGKIDFIGEFENIQHNKVEKFTFLRDFFGEVIGDINSPLLKTMRAVLYLYDESRQNNYLGSIGVIDGYVNYCIKIPDRAKEAIKLIETEHKNLAKLVSPTMIAGSKADNIYFQNKAFKLSQNSSNGIRNESIFALGRIEYNEKKYIKKSLTKLSELAANETDDCVLSNILNAAFQLYKMDNSLYTPTNALIKLVLEKGGRLTLHAGAVILASDGVNMRPRMLNTLLSRLVEVNQKNKVTLEHIDRGLCNLLKGKNKTKGIQFLENLLMNNKDAIGINDLETTKYFLYENNDGILNTLMTKWFLGGNPHLCDSIYDVVRYNPKDEYKLEVDISLLGNSNFNELFFIARKAIGYLGIYSVVATSVVLSLLPLIKDKNHLEELTRLIFNPILLNFPGKVGDFIKERRKSKDENISKVCKEAIKRLDQYYESLESARNIKELYPPQSQRETHQRNWSRKLDKDFKKAEKNSIISMIATKQVLLFGNGVRNSSNIPH